MSYVPIPNFTRKHLTVNESFLKSIVMQVGTPSIKVTLRLEWA